MSGGAKDGDAARKLREEIAEAVAEVGDTAVELALDGELLAQIPVFGFLVRFGKVAADVRHELYLRKLDRFLREIARSTPTERRSFMTKIQADDKVSELGENMLILIDRADDMEKCQVIGRLALALMREEIDYRTAIRLCQSVTRCFSEDLEFLRGTTQEEDTPKYRAAMQSLLASGLAFSHEAAGRVSLHLNRYAALLLQHALRPADVARERNVGC